MLRGFAVVLLALASFACASRPRIDSETRAALPTRAYVSLPSLADDLNLYYHGEDSGYIELSSPPDNVVLVEGGRRALVNGKSVPLDVPCQLRGREFVVASADAAKVSRALAAMRSERVATRPPPVAPRIPAYRPTKGLRAEWQPEAPPRAWKKIVIHHSAADRGDVAFLNLVHKREGMDGLGYHFVIGNGTLSGDGEVEVGYRWRRQIHGAHARVRKGDDNWWNLHSIGICLVGNFCSEAPSDAQLDSLVELVRELQATYGIPTSGVLPHRDVKSTLCPGPCFPWREFQARLRR